MNKPFVPVFVLAAFLLIAGCREYKIVVSLEPDGSGTRSQTFTTDPSFGHEGEPSLQEFRELMGLRERDGWSIDDSGDQMKGKKLVFRRETAIPDLKGWDRAGGGLTIRGTLEDGPLSDVALTNTIAVEAAEGATGRTLTYRETLTWTALKRTVIGYMAGRYGELMRDAYPVLTPETIGELRGLYRGHLALFDFIQAEEDFPPPGLHAIALSIASESRALFDRKWRRPPISEIVPLVEEAFDDSTDSLDRFIEEKLPGVELAGAMEIHIQVVMPGVILQSNADVVEGRFASWKTDSWTALDRPVELFVRSAIEEP